MSDYYELIGTTPKTVKLREICWETCAAPEGAEPSGPVHRWTHICRDENGNTIPEKDWQGYDKIYRQMSQKNTQSLAGYMNGFKILLS